MGEEKRRGVFLQHVCARSSCVRPGLGDIGSAPAHLALSGQLEMAFPQGKQLSMQLAKLDDASV